MMKHNDEHKLLWSAGTMFVITFCLAGAAGQNMPSNVKEDLDSECLYCTCYAFSGCNYTDTCRIVDKKVCGPFYITLLYWRDGGSLGNNIGNSEIENYKDCVTNRACAEQTIQNYHKKYYYDCNGDGKVDCIDFFRKHVNGPNACKEKGMDSGLFWLRFLQCYLNSADDVELALNRIRGSSSQQ